MPHLIVGYSSHDTASTNTTLVDDSIRFRVMSLLQKAAKKLLTTHMLIATIFTTLLVPVTKADESWQPGGSEQMVQLLEWCRHVAVPSTIPHAPSSQQLPQYVVHFGVTVESKTSQPRG